MINFLLAFCLGLSSKMTDLCGEHGWKPFPAAGYVFGIITAGFIVYLLLNTPVPVVTLMLSILVGLIFAGKIDTLSHQLAVGLALLAILATGFPKVNYLLLLLFTAVSVLDEKVNDSAPRLRKKHRLLAKFLDLRPLLEIAALLVSLWIRDLSLWLMLFSYDIGYLIAARMKW